jgi:hypothetical protein
MDVTLEFRATEKYPKEGEYIAMFHSHDTVKITSWNRAEELYEDMTGITVGFVTSLYFEGSTPMIVIKNCMAENEMAQKLFGTTVITNADESLVLDIFICSGDKELNISHFSDDVVNLIRTIDLYNNFKFAYNNLTKKLFHEFCDYFNLKRLEEPKKEEPKKEEPKEEDLSVDELDFSNLSNDEKSKMLDEWLQEGIPDERLEEYLEKELDVDIDFLLETEPQIFLGGHGYKKLSIVSDLLFSVKGDENVLYLKPLAREFLLSCSYFGSEIDIISENPEVCRKMLDACDLPYFNVSREIIKFDSYDLILPSTSNFLGFNESFKILYGIESILLVTSILNKSWDSIKRALNVVFGTSFSYDSFKLNKIINTILEDEKNN